MGGERLLRMGVRGALRVSLAPLAILLLMLRWSFLLLMMVLLQPQLLVRQLLL